MGPGSFEKKIKNEGIFKSTKVIVNQERAETHRLDEKCSAVCSNLFCLQRVSPHWLNDSMGFKANILFTHKLVTWPARIFNTSERLLGLHRRTETRETLSNWISCSCCSAVQPLPVAVWLKNHLIKRWRHKKTSEAMRKKCLKEMSVLTSKDVNNGMLQFRTMNRYMYMHEHMVVYIYICI